MNKGFDPRLCGLPSLVEDPASPAANNHEPEIPGTTFPVQGSAITPFGFHNQDKAALGFVNFSALAELWKSATV
ncbi:hypothetical protein NKH84_28075 [Mesorhizobium sp. M0902]|uniref:hypothetical protein n=1 Tax=unclassified Mesorhizobium TaxID=325217 RepID=UPI003336414C